MNQQSLVTAVKEAFRLLILAVPGILIQVASGDAAIATAYGGAILVALKSLDRSVHENPNLQAKGILPF